MPNVYDIVESALQRQGLGGMLQRSRQAINCEQSELPISTNVLPDNKQKIVISDSCIEDIALIKATIDQQKETGTRFELGFALFGQYKDGVMHIDKVVYHPEEFRAGNRREADMKQLSNEYIEYCKSVDNPAVILGHTHPTTSKNDPMYSIESCHSLHDLYQLKEIERIGKMFNRNAKVAGMVLNGAGDFNTIFYDSETDSFSRSSNISLENTGPLPSFTDGHYLEPTPQIQRISPEELHEFARKHQTTQSQTHSQRPIIQRNNQNEEQKPKRESFIKRLGDKLKKYVCMLVPPRSYEKELNHLKAMSERTIENMNRIRQL